MVYQFRIASGLLVAIRPPNTITATDGTIEVIKLLLDYITSTVISQRLTYTSLLRDTLLEVHQVLMENSALRFVNVLVYYSFCLWWVFQCYCCPMAHLSGCTLMLCLCILDFTLSRHLSVWPYIDVVSLFYLETVTHLSAHSLDTCYISTHIYCT